MTREEEPREGQQDRGSSRWETYHSFERVAGSLGIPEELWQEPAVKSFIEVNRQVQVLKSTLHWRTEPQNATDSGPSETPTLRNRYAAISKLVRVSEIILKDGLEYTPIAASESDRTYVGELLNFALDRLGYGLTVVDTKEGPRQNPGSDGIIDVPPTPTPAPTRLAPGDLGDAK